MSVKNAPPLTAEQKRMIAFYGAHAPAYGLGSIGWGRNKSGEWHSEFAKLAWKAWQEAQRQ